MKVKHISSLALALLLAINIVPGRVDASQVMEEMPKQETMSEEKDVENPIPLSDETTKDDEIKAFEEKVAKAKEELKKYIDSMDEESVDNPAIVYEGQAKEDIKNAIARAKELLNDEEIDQAKLEEIEKIPFKKVDGKKQGLFRDYTHKALVNFEVEGERSNKNPHNNKSYVGLRDNKIMIKSIFKGLKKSGESKNKFIKLNYVTESDYQAMKLDGVSAATPKYKKQELPQDDYIIREVEDGYEIEITKLPADAKFIKPIALVKFADGTYFENGDIVYVKNENSSANSSNPDKVDEKSGDTEKSEQKKEAKKDHKKSQKVDQIREDTKKDKKEGLKQETKQDVKASSQNVKTGVGSSLIAILSFGASSTALFASKKRK